MALQPSPRLALLLLLSHALAAAAVYATALPAPLSPVLLILILTSLLYHLARDALLLLPASWREILLEPDGISVITLDGKKFSGQATGRTFVSPHFTVLHIRQQESGRTVSRVIFPDAPGREAYRDLSVRLKYAY